MDLMQISCPLLYTQRRNCYSQARRLFRYQIESMRSKRVLILLVMAAGLVFIGIEVVQHMREQALRDPAALLRLTPGASVQVRNFHRSMIEDGRKTWEVKGAEATYFKGEERAVIRRPRLVFHREDGRTLEATSREGNVFLPGGRLERAELEGPVEMTYQRARFHTDRLIYLHAEDRMVSPGKVRGTMDGAEFEGESMTYSLAHETVELNGAVKTTIHPGRLGRAKTAGRLTGEKDASR